MKIDSKNSFKIKHTEFEGLIILEPTVHTDHRGGFYESWREEEYKQAGIKERFVQDSISQSRKDVLRGLHYQKNTGQLVWASYGKVLDVVVDIRAASPTFKQHFKIELGGDKPQQLYIPPGFAHGFFVLSDYVVFQYKTTQYYSPSDEGGILWCDPELQIEWPVEHPILSNKDSQLPLLNHV